ncbi:MAG: hypothetical protein C4567_12630 [Deltaproteobacteria bacterium]|nr:MAG: hypothetical protein C4567_12630 [Deltaproteobacteria bacterium]
MGQKFSQSLKAVENAIAQQRLEGLEVPPDVAEEMKRAAKGEIDIEEGIRNTFRKGDNEKFATFIRDNLRKLYKTEN